MKTNSTDCLQQKFLVYVYTEKQLPLTAQNAMDIIESVSQREEVSVSVFAF